MVMESHGKVNEFHFLISMGTLLNNGTEAMIYKDHAGIKYCLINNNTAFTDRMIEIGGPQI